MRILVTGATGFLGGATSRQLARDGHDVLATGRDSERGQALARSGLSFRVADLGHDDAARELVEGMDAVVHCAALSSPWGARTDFERANVTATALLTRACLAAGAKRLVHISTPSIYMGRGDRELVREDDPLPRPINHYAETKLAAEHVVRAAHQAGLPSIILRPRAIFGPGDTAIFPRLFRALESGLFPLIGDGLNRVDLTYVDNVVDAIGRALLAPPAALGQTYNITNGEPVRLWEVIARLCTALALPHPRGRVPVRVGMALAYGLELTHKLLWPGREPRLTRYTVEVLARTMTLDISRARSVLGYTPQVSMDEGLERFIDWWQRPTRSASAARKEQQWGG